MNHWHEEPSGGMAGFFRGWHGARRVARGDMGPIVLNVLLEKPMHGYEIIRHLEERSRGFWRPSAGSIYPTLQLLEEQDLVSSQELDGKKVYTITEKGREEAGKTQGRHPWDDADSTPSVELWKTFPGFMHAIKHLCRKGTDEQIKKAAAIIEKARQEIDALSNLENL